MPEPPRPSRKPKPSEFRRIKRLQPTEGILYKCESGMDGWPLSGQKDRYYEYETVYLRFLKRNRKKKPQIMVIGPGKGEDILEFQREMTKKGIHPEIDVFGLTNSLYPEVYKVIRRDYSRRIALETVGANPEKYPYLIDALKGKYDLVTSFMSAGIYTNFPVHNCFFMAMMLAVRGEAHIDYINPYWNKLDKLKSKLNLESFPRIFSKLVATYNRLHNTNYKFELEHLGNAVRIKRIS